MSTDQDTTNTEPTQDPEWDALVSLDLDALWLAMRPYFEANLRAWEAVKQARDADPNRNDTAYWALEDVYLETHTAHSDVEYLYAEKYFNVHPLEIQP